MVFAFFVRLHLRLKLRSAANDNHGNTITEAGNHLWDSGNP